MELQGRYTSALLREMELRHAELASDNACNVDTIYIGGGTPSTLGTVHMGQILQKIREVYKGFPREITVEMNPDDVTDEYIAALKSLGVNRISMGVQSFDDNRLKFLRRRHSARQAVDAIDTIRMAGIDNVSIDLIFGFPEEDLDDWQKDVATAVSIAPNHISAYCLMYEEGTPLYRMLEDNKVRQIDDETYIAMYAKLIDMLCAHGYEHYEISNFAQPGYRSIHNSSYWHDVPYLGFGASAHSYTRKRRSWNIDNIREYMASIEKGILPYEYEDIDADTHYNDLITTALRTSEGLDMSILSDEYKKFALECARESLMNNTLEISGSSLRLTRKGLFISDTIMSSLMKV